MCHAPEHRQGTHLPVSNGHWACTPVVLGQCNARSMFCFCFWTEPYYTAWWYCVNSLLKDVMWSGISEVGVEPTTFWLYCHDCNAIDFPWFFMHSPIHQWQWWIYLALMVHHFEWQKFNITTKLIIYIMNCNSVFVWEIVITDSNTVKVVTCLVNVICNKTIDCGYVILPVCQSAIRPACQ